MTLFLYTGYPDEGTWPEREYINNRPEEFEQSQSFENQNSSNASNFDQNTFTCLLCGKVYTWLYSLKRHQLKCGNKEAQYQCRMCDKRYYRVDSLKYHQETIHNSYEYKRRR